MQALHNQHERYKRRWSWLSLWHWPGLSQIGRWIDRRRRAQRGLVKYRLSEDVAANTQILVQLREYNRLVDRANDLERMNQSYRHHKLQQWQSLYLVPVVLMIISAIAGAISTQNAFNEAVLCPSEQSLCWLLRWDEMKRVIKK